jgi:hypothetical protein
MISAQATPLKTEPTTYFALSMNGARVGYARYQSHKTSYHGHPAKQTASLTRLSVAMEGQSMDLEVTGTSIFNLAGKPLEMKVVTKSGGKIQTLLAHFRGQTVDVTANNDGAIAHRQLKVPAGSLVTDDPISAFLGQQTRSNQFLLLDPTTVTLVRNSVQPGKPRKFGATMARSFKIIDPRALTEVFLDDQNRIIEVDAPLGIIMRPTTKIEAMRAATSRADIESDSKIQPTGSEPSDFFHVSHVKLAVTTKSDLSSLQSDDHETIRKDGEGWVIDVHPPKVKVPAHATISEAAKAAKTWTEPDLYVPSSSTRFRTLAQKIVGSQTDVGKAAQAIQTYVYSTLRGDAGMGLLRDANDVLNSKRGVCRDYAILTTTLLRAARIPSRLATGLVSWDGPFYYHAWTEYFNGTHWIGLDSTTNDPQISAAHVKLATGTVEQAFLPLFLESPSLKWLEHSSD